jgi:hypothetical protein
VPNLRDDQWLKLDDLARRLESDTLTVRRHAEREGMPTSPDGNLFNRAAVFKWMLGRGCDATYLRYALQPQLKKAWVVTYSPAEDWGLGAIADFARFGLATDEFTLGAKCAAYPAWCVVIDGAMGIETVRDLLFDMGKDRPLVVVVDPAYDFQFMEEQIESLVPTDVGAVRKAVVKLYRKAGGDIEHLIARSEECGQ